jgi:hypothetical protein
MSDATMTNDPSHFEPRHQIQCERRIQINRTPTINERVEGSFTKTMNGFHITNTAREHQEDAASTLNGFIFRILSFQAPKECFFLSEVNSLFHSV